MKLLKKTTLLFAAILAALAIGCTAPAQTITSTMTQTATATVTTTQTTTATVTAVPVSLNISAASSLTNALNEVNKLYTQSKPWVTITPSYGSSGTLQTQIENGAPCDVFLSAASSNMDTLQNKGLLLDGSRKNLLTNKIVLIVPKASTLSLKTFNDLTLPTVILIAIGDPKSVPAGTYAQQAFTELGILTAIQSKFVLGANVTQVLQYVSTGNVDAGIVYSTDALSDPNVTVVATGPASVNASIVYPTAIIKASKNATAAQDYLKFLSSAQAKTIFEKYGFAIATQ